MLGDIDKEAAQISEKKPTNSLLLHDKLEEKLDDLWHQLLGENSLFVVRSCCKSTGYWYLL